MPYSMTFASNDASKAKNMWGFSTSVFLGQWGIFMLLGLLVFTPVFGTPEWFGMMLPVGFIGGKVFLHVIKRPKYLDQQTVKSISGASTDFMIAFGIASIKPDAVADFLVPLLILFVLGIAYCCVFFFVFAPLFFGDQWLERGIFGWGWATAAVATGIALLKIVDPDLKSGTMNEYGIAYVGFAPFEIGMNIVAPIAVIAGFTWGIGGIATVFAIAVILFAAFRGWFPKRTGVRPGKASAHQGP